MSVSVFHRFAMSDARAPRGPPPGLEIERARRVLNFGDNQSPPAGLVAAEELADTMKRKSSQWGFDFSQGVPMEGANSRLKWSRVDKADSVHESYAFDKLPFLRSHAAVTPTECTQTTSVNRPKQTRSSRQPSIAEFLPKRKKPSSGSSSASSSKSSCSSSTGSMGSMGSMGATASGEAGEPSAKKPKTMSSI